MRRILSAPRHRIALLVASLVVAHVTGASPAFAQPKGAAAAGPSDATVRKALDLFKKGQVLYKAAKFAEALPLFRESFGLVNSPNSRFYIARCLAGTGDPVGGYLEFEEVIADIDTRNEAKYQDTRGNAVKERDELVAKIALVTITVANAQASTAVSLGGKDIPRESWGKALPLMPGPVELSLTAPPAAPRLQTLDLHAGESRPVALDTVVKAAINVPPPPPPGGGSNAVLRPVSYLAAGIGVAGFAVFGVAGGLATSTYSDLEKQCSSGTGTRVCPTAAKGQIDDGKLQQDIANIGLVVGAVGLAAGVTLFVVSMDRGPKKDDAAQVQAVVGPSYLGLQGTF